nr:NADH dehydrogenase subunit 4 [Scapholeberis mucronata]
MLKLLLSSILIVCMANLWVECTLWLMLLSGVLMISTSSFDLGLANFMVLDTLSVTLCFLSLWVTSLMIMMSFYVKSARGFSTLFMMLILAMSACLVLSFSTSNMLLFYVSFEASLIPIFMLVMGWGYQPERMKAGYFLLFYTLTASLPLLISVLYIKSLFSTFNLELISFSSSPHAFLSLGIILAFLVKLPTYFGHLWLPKAHVEAPVAGSMILAGVLLKLGGYGIVRFSVFIEMFTMTFSSVILSVAILGGVLSSLICLRQTDCKSLVAYSSVSHMSLVLMAVALNSYYSLSAIIVIMFSHGLCSSGLFSLVGMLYDRVSTRSIVLIRGIISYAPLMTLWWFLFSITNMAAPPTPNLLGEIFMFVAAVQSSTLLVISLMITCFMAAAYSLYLFIATQHGGEISSVGTAHDASLTDHAVMMLHLSTLMAFLPFLGAL